MDGDELKRLRLLAGLNREKLAVAAGIHSSTVGRIERNEQDVIYVATAAAMVAALNEALKNAGRRERASLDKLMAGAA